MYCLRHRRLYLSGEAFQKLDVGNRNNNWENNTQDGSIPDGNLFDSLHEDENDGLERNLKDGCSDLVQGIASPYIYIPCLSREVGLINKANEKCRGECKCKCEYECK